jgi:predicted peptidase
MRLSACCLLAILFFSPVKAQNIESGVWNKRAVVDATGKLPAELPYRLWVPTEYDATKKYPLVVYLHGAGERGTDNEKHIAKNGAPRLVGELQLKQACFVLAPQVPDGKRWVEVHWGEKETHEMPAEPSDAMRLLLQLLDELPREFSLDAKRFYLTGLSMGGFGAWELLVRRPEMFAAAVPICGGADNSTAEQIKHIPIWTFHGDADTVVWPQRTRSMVAALQALNAPVQYTEYPGIGHNSWDKAYNEPGLFDWLLAHQKKD